MSLSSPISKTLAKKVRISDLLVLLLFLLTALAVIFLGPTIYSRSTSADYFESVSRNDPETGKRLNLNPGKSSSSLPSSPRYLAIFLGPCQSCSVNAFDPDQLRVEKSVHVVLIIRADEQGIPSSFRGHPNTTVLPDADREIERVFNAVWYPRMYLLDGNQKLIWAQARPGELLAGVSYVQGRK